MLTVGKTVLQPFRGFSVRTQGASHIAKRISCEDFALCAESDKCIVAIVCDGHGASDCVRSRIGSEYAAEAAKELVKDFVAIVDERKLETEKSRCEIFRQLEASIIAKWDEKIWQHHNENPFSEEEFASVSEKAKELYKGGQIRRAYGTTIIVAVLTERYWFVLQLGDGDCVVLDDSGAFYRPIPEDERCVFNQTTSICDNDAISEFRHYFSREFPQALFVATDGVANSYPGDNAAMYDFYRRIYESFTNGVISWDEAKEELQGYIPLLSERRSRDDISIAGIIGEAITVGMRNNHMQNESVSEQIANSKNDAIANESATQNSDIPCEGCECQVSESDDSNAMVTEQIAADNKNTTDVAVNPVALETEIKIDVTVTERM